MGAETLTIDIKKTAYLSLDFMNANLKGGKRKHTGIAEQAAQNNIVEYARAALDASRKAGVLVIHVRVAFREGYPEFGGTGAPSSPLFTRIKNDGAYLDGTWDGQIIDELAPKEGEIVVIKNGVSAFVGTPLEKILRNSGITHVVATGVATSNAVEGTVRHASDLGFAPIVLRDCVANYSKEMNDFVLDRILPMHAIISDSGEYIEALKRSGKV